MKLLDSNNAAEYLRQTGRIAAGEEVSVCELAGGVSNVTLSVSRRGGIGPEFVLKQARRQLRVEQPWFCSVERIWREVETLKICREILDRETDSARSPLEGREQERALHAVTPRVLWEDRENYVFAMSAAPPHRVWKADLLAGQAESRIAEACGRLLGCLHAGAWQDKSVAARIGDKTFFADLRVDPYYRRAAEQHPALGSSLADLMQAVSTAETCLVHGDFSPKNLLVYEGGLMLVDFEVGHFGDPAFDLGFFLSHLSLKALFHAPRHEPYLALARTFWREYFAVLSSAVASDERAALGERTLTNLAGCALARVDGKSPVEYLTDQRLKTAARRFAYRLFAEKGPDWLSAEAALRELCESLPHATN